MESETSVSPIDKINAFFAEHGYHANEAELKMIGVRLVPIDDAYLGRGVGVDIEMQVKRYIQAKVEGKATPSRLATVISAEGKLCIPVAIA